MWWHLTATISQMKLAPPSPPVYAFLTVVHAADLNYRRTDCLVSFVFIIILASCKCFV